MGRLPNMFDLIVGDFGRTATIRYFEEFSKAERKILQAKYGHDHFYDEYRSVEYAIVGRIQTVKRDLLENHFLTQNRLDSRILVGTEAGPSLEEIENNLIECTLPWLRTALDASPAPRRVRIVFPCNTLSLLAKRVASCISTRQVPPSTSQKRCYLALLQTLDSVPASQVEVLDVITSVANAIVRARIPRLKFLGTALSLLAYQQEFSALGESVDLSPLPEELFLESLHHTLSGDVCRPLPGEEAVWPESDVPILCGCTDLVIANSLDSLAIFAQTAASRAYDVPHPVLSVTRLRKGARCESAS
jgi:hypothetical protein